MPLAYLLWGVFLQIAGTLVGKVLVSLGIGYITYTGVDASLTWAKMQFLTSLSGAAAATVGLASVMKVGVCVSMLLSALTMRLVLGGLTSGTMKRMVIK